VQKGTQSMLPEENKATVRRAIEEGWNQGQVAIFDELNDPNFLYHDPGAPGVRTNEDYKRWVTERLSAFSNLHVTIEDLVTDQDEVAMRWPIRGAHTGDLLTPMPLPATGKQVTVSGITLVRLAFGKGVEVWSQGDTLGFLQQLGVIPAPEQAR
jgi:predicted ester cyclase